MKKDIDKKAKPLFSLNSKEKAKLINNLNNSLKNFNPKKAKISDEEKMWIRQATNCGCDELYNLGSYFAYIAVEEYYKNLASKYKDDKNTEVNDFLSELYIVVHNNINRYDGVHSLFTFMEPVVNSAFMIARGMGKGRGVSKYYQDIGVTVKRAEHELAAQGFDEPSILDLRDYIKHKFKRNISETTIEKYKIYSQTEESMDGSEKQYASGEGYNPEALYLEEEKRVEFYNAVEKLSPRYKLYIMKELEYISLYGTMPSVEKVFNKMKTECENLTMYEATQIRRAAHIELKGYFLRTKNSYAPLNRMRTLKANIDIIQEDEQNVIDAVNDGQLDELIPKTKVEAIEMPEVNLDEISKI